MAGIEIPISKFQIPNNSQSPNDQIPKQIRLGWVIRDWNLDIVWVLVLGNWCFPSVADISLPFCAQLYS
jgi:hypothetical protein